MNAKMWQQLILFSVAILLGMPAAPTFVGVAWLSTAANAEDNPNADEIFRSLKPRKKRSLLREDSPTDARLNELTQIRRKRGLNHQERSEFYELSRAKPQIDLTIYFAYDSAEISEQAARALDELGQALARDEFKGGTFAVAGHTDGKGSEEYNIPLSERRAEAVKRYLVERFKINSVELQTFGYGYEQLKNPQNALADVNRRVQIVNVSQ